MFQYFKYPVLVFAFVGLLGLSTPFSSKAESIVMPHSEDTAYDLINAVNALRASNGLSAYNISPILMFTAQSQADFMAATGNVTHYGAGGTSVTDRLLAAGYPLAGDLSLGGFRSENIIGGTTSMTAQEAVNAWTGDAPHLTTMLSPNLTEIGAGVTVTGGRVYYVIDCAHPTTNGASQALSTVVGGEATIPVIEAVIFPVILSTPNADGDVIHEVKAGQSLWQIAIDYGVKIDDIKRLNNLADNGIYPGDKLLIKKNAVLPTASLTLSSPTIESTNTPTVTPTRTVTAQVTNTLASPVSKGNSTNNNTIMISVIGILVLALLGGGVFTLLGDTKEK